MAALLRSAFPSRAAGGSAPEVRSRPAGPDDARRAHPCAVPGRGRVDGPRDRALPVRVAREGRAGALRRRRRRPRRRARRERRERPRLFPLRLGHPRAVDGDPPRPSGRHRPRGAGLGRRPDADAARAARSARGRIERDQPGREPPQREGRTDPPGPPGVLRDLRPLLHAPVEPPLRRGRSPESSWSMVRHPSSSSSRAIRASAASFRSRTSAWGSSVAISPRSGSESLRRSVVSSRRRRWRRCSRSGTRAGA